MSTIYLNDDRIISDDDWNKMLKYFKAVSSRLKLTGVWKDHEDGVEELEQKVGKFNVSLFAFYTKEAIEDRVGEEYPNVNKVVTIAITYMGKQVLIDEILYCYRLGKMLFPKRSRVVRTACQGRYKRMRRK